MSILGYTLKKWEEVPIGAQIIINGVKCMKGENELLACADGRSMFLTCCNKQVYVKDEPEAGFTEWFSEAFKKVTGRDCGCKERKSALQDGIIKRLSERSM
jgi:hypothetical protein